MTLLRRPLSLSVVLHGSLLFIAFLLSISWNFAKSKKIDFEVLQYPVAAPANLKISQTPERIKEKPVEPKKSVFGVSRKAITTNSSNENSAEVKAGNTVAKAPDSLNLEKDDPDSLPIPADDYLVSSMPRLRSEVRIPYPPEAKKAGVEGPVVMDLLIDSDGKVRQVVLLKGPGFGLDEAAVQAVRGFEFIPARVGDKTVAVKIRYTYRFVLENK